MIRAKLVCVSVLKHHNSEQVKLQPVYSTEPANENHSWAKFTPAGEVSLTITNELAFGGFIPGREYLASFEVAE